MKPSYGPPYRLPIYDGSQLKNWLTIVRDPAPRWKRAAELDAKRRPNGRNRTANGMTVPPLE
ncbi:hypothetical protein A8B75_14350 [Sphingomonadales bacterium EhC05]|nr:hypothetical protein A8B75_14350 [Sphingomonadales bacterium EhC05]